MRNDLEQFRTRWYRWLGQKCRTDKPYWLTLIDTNWFGWASNILEREYLFCPYASQTREEVKKYFHKAIECADMRDLRQLDNLYCEDKISS
jgi:hypothetical protein